MSLMQKSKHKSENLNFLNAFNVISVIHSRCNVIALILFCNVLA